MSCTESKDPIRHYFRLKQPCANCPFRKVGAIELRPGRVEGIISGLLDEDSSSFDCHKTVHSSRGGTWSDEQGYQPSGHEAMCAGAAALLMKRERPTVGMRFAFVLGAVSPNDWDEAQKVVVD